MWFASASRLPPVTKGLCRLLSGVVCSRVSLLMLAHYLVVENTERRCRYIMHCSLDLLLMIIRPQWATGAKKPVCREIASKPVRM